MRWAIILLIAFGLGWWLAPSDLTTEVKEGGFLRSQTRRTLAATVESLRAEGNLVVLRHKGTVRVEVERSRWIVLGGHQQLIVAGVVPYHIDLRRIAYTVAGETVTVTIPAPQLGDIAFESEGAVVLNDGVLTYDDDQVAELLRANYAEARRAMTAQAQGFRWLAEQRARDEVTRALAPLGLRVVIQTGKD